MSDMISKITTFWHKNPERTKHSKKTALIANHKFQHHSTKDLFAPKKVVHVFKTNYSLLKRLQSHTTKDIE